MAFAVRPALVISAIALAACGLVACKSSGTDASGDAGATAPGRAIRLLVDTILSGSPATGGAAFPGGANGAKAAAAALNKSGGINGHKIVIDPCDNKADPDGGAACARTAVQNGDIAVVGSFDPVGASTALPILQKAGIPYVGGLPGSPSELASPISFQFDGGINLGAFGTIAQMKAEGCASAVDFSPGGPAAALDPVLAAQYTKAGIKFTKVMAVTGTTDMAPAVSEALAAHPQCVVAEGPAPDIAKIIAGIRKVGSTVRIFTSINALVPQVLGSMGKLADGVYANNPTELGTSSDPLVTQFRTDTIASMGKRAGAQNLNEFAQDGWSSVMVVKQALKGVTNISAKNLLAALDKMTDATPGNVHDPVDFARIRKSKLYPRMFNTYVRYFVVRSGQYTELDSQWHDVSANLP